MPVDKFLALSRQKQIAERKRAQQQAAASGKARAGGTEGQQLIIPEASQRVESQTSQSPASTEPAVTQDTPSGTDGGSIRRPLWKALGLQNPNTPQRTLGEALGVGPVSPEVAATPSTNPIIGLPINQPPTPAPPLLDPDTARVSKQLAQGMEPISQAGVVPLDPNKPLVSQELIDRLAELAGQAGEMVPARETMWKQSRGVTVSLPKQEHSFRRIKDGRNLLGGKNDYVYYGNSRDRGTFAKYPGISKRYNTNPNTNETMARLAIPISGDVDAFILKTFGSDPHMTRLSKAIMTNGNSGLGYIDFLLQNIQESFSEKAQISETVGDNYVAFFFGSAPPVFVFSGQLLNTFQDEWRTSMHLLYQNLLRGTKLARNKQLVSIYYDQIIANGYIMSHNQNYAAEMQMASSFSFQMLIKSITFFRLPLTLPTMPSKLPRNISFQNVFGMEREAIRRSTRTVGVVNAESAPSKVEPEIKPEITPAGPQKGTEAYRQAYRQLIRQSHRRHDTTPFSPAEQQKRKEVYRLPVIDLSE